MLFRSIFEAIGIDKSVIDKYFTNTVSRIGGITLQDIENDVNVDFDDQATEILVEDETMLLDGNAKTAPLPMR